MISNGFFIKSFLLLALCATASCSNDATQKKSNAAFEAKFGSQVSKINALRTPPQLVSQDQENGVVMQQRTNHSKFANPNELLGISGYDQYSSASVDTAKFGLKRQENFSPDARTLMEGKSSERKLPEDMFDLTYNTTLNQPFVTSGLEFDAIIIPRYDYYGIASTLNEKSYLLAGNKILQQNIDDLTKSQSEEDIELSEILIKEQRQLKKQQKLAIIFGEDSSFVEQEKIKKGEAIEKEEKLPILDDPLRKAIALQIIKQNFAHNNPVTPNNAASQNTQ